MAANEPLSPPELELEREAPNVGVRQGGDRRTHDRRAVDRGTRDRRRRARRRSAMHGMLLSALAFAMPHQVLKQRIVNAHLPRVLASKPPGPRVAVTINSFEPVPPDRAYDALIREASKKYGLNPTLIRGVIRMESGFDPSAVSRVGAMGLMQLMPEVAAELGVTNPFDPRQNIMAGSRLLRDLLDRHKGNLALTLASYNAGPGAVAKYRNRVPPYPETRKYVKQITTWMSDERATTD
jgi:soluble lytic murein transglycosylase-like protein